MTVTFPLYFASANGFPYCLTVKSYTPFSGVSLAKPGKAERRDVPATAATDNTLWRRLKKALWSSSSSRTILFSSVVASKEDDDEFVGKCIVRFPPPFRERHRRDNVGGLEEENDKKTVVVILGVSLSLSFTVVYCAEFCGESCCGNNNNNVSVSRLSCTHVLGRQRKRKSEVFRQKEHSVSIPFVHAFAARRRRRISLLFVAFFFARSDILHT